MTLRELVSALRAASSDPVVTTLAALVDQWKSEPASVDDLRETVERYIGNSWIASDNEHKEVYRIWSEFRDENIGGRLAMTMNERLFAFDLFERYDASRTLEEKTVVLRKVDHENKPKA